MLVVSLLLLSLGFVSAADDDDDAPLDCVGNDSCWAYAYGTASEQDKCFHEDQYYMKELKINHRPEGEAYCWDGRCMNKRSYGEPCKNEAGNKDNNLCQTAYCDPNGLCDWREGTKDCRDKDTGKKALIALNDKGGGYGECEGDCDSDGMCAGDLKCWHRSASAPANPPGCSGYPKDLGVKWTITHDYCFDPSKLTYLGWDGHPDKNCACLEECRGDCDSDNDCIGGLKCYQRGHGDPTPPGCKFPSNWNTANIIDADFCYDPTKLKGNNYAQWYKGDAVPATDHKFEVKVLFPGPEYAVALLAIFALVCFVWTVMIRRCRTKVAKPVFRVLNQCEDSQEEDNCL